MDHIWFYFEEGRLYLNLLQSLPSGTPGTTGADGANGANGASTTGIGAVAPWGASGTDMRALFERGDAKTFAALLQNSTQASPDSVLVEPASSEGIAPQVDGERLPLPAGGGDVLPNGGESLPPGTVARLAEQAQPPNLRTSTKPAPGYMQPMGLDADGAFARGEQSLHQADLRRLAQSQLETLASDSGRSAAGQTTDQTASLKNITFARADQTVGYPAQARGSMPQLDNTHVLHGAQVQRNASAQLNNNQQTGSSPAGVALQTSGADMSNGQAQVGANRGTPGQIQAQTGFADTFAMSGKADSAAKHAKTAASGPATSAGNHTDNADPGAANRGESHSRSNAGNNRHTANAIASMQAALAGEGRSADSASLLRETVGAAGSGAYSLRGESPQNHSPVSAGAPYVSQAQADLTQNHFAKPQMTRAELANAQTGNAYLSNQAPTQQTVPMLNQSIANYRVQSRLERQNSQGPESSVNERLRSDTTLQTRVPGATSVTQELVLEPPRTTPLPHLSPLPLSQTSGATGGFNTQLANTSGLGTANANGDTAAAALSQKVHAQISQALSRQALTSGRLTLQLQPHQLGSIDVSFSQEQGETQVVIVAREAATRDLLETNLPRLRQDLQDAGVDLAKLDIKHERSDRGSDGSGDFGDADQRDQSGLDLSQGQSNGQNTSQNTLTNDGLPPDRSQSDANSHLLDAYV